MKTSIYWQDPKYPAKRMDFIFDPSLVLYLPLHRLDGASFMSKDAYGHLCTVTGALWTPRGRSFDGADDYIDCGSSGFPTGNSARTVLCWINPDTIANYDMFFNYGTAAGSQGFLFMFGIGAYLLIGKYAGNADAQGDTAISTEMWSFIGATLSGSDIGYFLNGQADGTATLAGVNTVLDKCKIGENYWTSSGNFDGLIGEVGLYNRVLTPLEIQHNYLATKWRYQ